jgi:hypothetical protein
MNKGPVQRNQNRNEVIDRRMSEMKIARFIGIEACKSVFSEKSTFVLRSPEYYRRLYETTARGDTKGDRNEGIAEKIGGGTAEFTGFLASCWTRLKGSEPTCREWDIFKKDEQNVVAIVTTPRLVSEFLNKTLRLDEDPAKRRFPFLSLDHRGVSYEMQAIDHPSISDVVPFTKDAAFVDQQEYRFVLKYAGLPVIDSLIFCAGVDYMERRADNRLNNFANPHMSPQNKKHLRKAILTARAGYGDFASRQICEITSADLRDSASRQTGELISDAVRNSVSKLICEIIANGEDILS